MIRNHIAHGKRAVIFIAALFALFAVSSSASGQTQPANGLARLTIKSAVLSEDRQILVRTPPGYQRGERYPVLYMTDGQAHIEHTASTIDFLARNGRMPQMIIVAITNTDRTRDLTPTKANMTRPDGNTAPLPTSGGADKFLKFIETELIPRIEQEYRTQPYRVFAGHSFGGLFAVHAFLTRPELFNAYIAVSPTMNWDNYLSVRRAEEFFKGRSELNRTLFVTLANEGGDMLEGFNRFKKILASRKPAGFAYESTLMEDEDHGSVVMRSHYFGFRKVFEGWQFTGDAAATGGLAAVENHYKKLSDKFGFTVQTPEPLMNQLGYQLLQNGKSEEAIAAFKSNVERYPGSANVYDSLAEAYERTGHLDLARPNYEKAYTLGRSNNDPNVEVYRTNLERVEGLIKKGQQSGDNK